MKSPLIVDVRHNSLDDGPGIRTAVFFKGCPLRCAWCHNPEAISPKAELAWFARQCIACGACAKACRHGAAVVRGGKAARITEECRACFACVEGCPTGARRRAGDEIAFEALVDDLVKDLPFYRNSGGGVTLTGGEPTMFLEFTGRLLAALKDRGVHTLVETCGLFPLDAFIARVLPHADLVYYDVKFVEPDLHARHTGVSNKIILDNLAALAADPSSRAKILPRVPLVPGFTAGHGNLRAIAGLLRGLGFTEARLLPYNPLWPEKAAAVGRTPAHAHDRFMPREDQAACEEVFFKALKGTM